MGMACTQCAVCKCSFSLGAAPLTVLPPTMAVATTGFVASIQHSKPFVNIAPMGLCMSPDHPMMKALKKPGPCIPMISAPWIPTAPTILTQAGPALSNLSMTMCQLKGIVKIIMPGSMPIMTTP